MKRVDFFIIGAPRCGTTAMSHYLAEHPSVCFAKPKEPWYFSKDLVTNYENTATTIDEYHDQFFPHYDEVVHQIIGEGSPSYLMSECAIKHILEYNPKARIIAMVRNPIEIAYSMHSVRYAVGPRHEDIPDFEEAWRSQQDRMKGKRLPEDVIKPCILQYKKIASVGSQLARIKPLVPEHQLHVIVNDDMKADTIGVYNDVLQFLGLEKPEKLEFPVLEGNREWKNEKLRTLYFFLTRIGQKFPINAGILSGIRASCIQKKGRSELSSAFREELRKEFKEEIDQISRILNRDLAHWQ